MDQLIGVLIGGTITIVTTIIAHIFNLWENAQKSKSEIKKINVEGEVEYKMERRKKLDEEKAKNVQLLRYYQKSEEILSFNGLDLSDTLLGGLDLRGLQLRSVNLIKSNLRHTCLPHADMEGAICIEADLEGCDLGNANLRNVDFTGANLRQANLLNTDLEGAIFSKANLKDCRIEEDKLRKCILHKTILPNGNVSNNS